MKRNSRGLSFAALVLLPALLVATTEAPPPKWALDAVDQMKAHGLVLEEDVPLVGSRTPSRYEIAVCTWAGYVVLESKTKELEAIAAESVEHPVRVAVPDRAAASLKDLDSLPGWLRDLPLMQKVTQEFEPELKEIGVDVPRLLVGETKLKARLGALERQTTLLEAKVSPFPDVPDNHWVYEAGRIMEQSWLLDSNTVSAVPVPSRAKAATWFLAAYDRLVGYDDKLADNVRKLSQLVGRKPQGDEATLLSRAVEAGMERLKSWREDMANLAKMARTFRAELEALGRDPRAMKTSIEEVLTRAAVSVRLPG